ncbi:MAG: hypothetical protein ACXADW_20345 [Candidatus Hodarchaeales archaeon]|jgi:hypothetical protein
MVTADVVISGLQIGVVISIAVFLFNFHKYKKSSIEKQAKFEQRIEDKLSVLCKFKTDFDSLDFVMKADCASCYQVQKTNDLKENIEKINDKLQSMEVVFAGFMGKTEKYIELTEGVLKKIDKRDNVNLIEQGG